MTKPNEQEDIIEELPEVEEGEEDNTDWKALAKKNQGIAKRYQTKLEKAKDKAKAKKEVKKPESKEEKTDGFDYAQKAFLKASGIKSSEFDFIEAKMTETGKELDDLLESNYFKSELKELRDLKASEDAIPDGTKRSTQTPKDRVDYWIAKGKLPPADQPKLRQEVVNKRLEKANTGSQFTTKPVVGI